MIDHGTEGDSAESAGAPANRDARREPGVIEGEIAAREPAGDEAPPRPAAAESESESAARPRGAGGFVGGAVAGLIVSALGLGAGYALMAPRTELSDAASRLGALETQARQDSAALAADSKREGAALAELGKRVGGLEAGAGASNTADLEKRVAALEAASAGNGSSSAAAGEAAQRLATLDKDLRGDIDAERGAISDLSARVAKLEAETQKANAAAADLGALAGRVDKVEGALAAPKNETRIVADKLAAADDATAIAIIAEVAEEKLRSGANLAPEIASLQRLGVDSAALAPLQAVASGAPTNGALAAAFDAVAPKALAATSKSENGGIMDRFLAHIHNLVQVRDLHETPGDDPQALASQIEAASRRGDIAGALAAFDKLPEAARQAAAGWATQARARQAADAALGSIREAAIARLAGGSKP